MRGPSGHNVGTLAFAIRSISRVFLIVKINLKKKVDVVRLRKNIQ